MFHHMQHYPNEYEQSCHQPAYMTPASTPAGRREGARILSGGQPIPREEEDSPHAHPAEYVVDRGYENSSHNLHIQTETQESSMPMHPFQSRSRHDDRDTTIADLTAKLNTTAVKLQSATENIYSLREQLSLAQSEVDTAQGIIKSLEVAKNELDERCNLLLSDKDWEAEKFRVMGERTKTLIEENKKLEDKCKRKKERITILEQVIGQMMEQSKDCKDHCERENAEMVSWVYYSGPKEWSHDEDEEEEED